MTLFFFYNKLTTNELLDEISSSYSVVDGYVMVCDYDLENNKVQFNNDADTNNKILVGKIVKFNDNFITVIQEIINLHKNQHITKTKYTIEKINSFDNNKNCYNTYIIHT